MNEQLKVIISAEINNLKQNVKKAKDEIKDLWKSGKENIKKLNDEFKDLGDKSKQALTTVGVAIAGATTALLGMTAATSEFRQSQALLQSAFETAGGSAEQAKSTYNDLYRVLGDNGQATEAAQHLAKLTTEQEALSEWTNICQGVYSTFSASLPIESLTEAANETAKTGALTGALSDALNWAGISEETFQAQLDECNTEAEREALIRQTLNDTYSEAAANYEKNNAAILSQNEAQAKLDETMASIGETLAPVNAMLTELGAKILAELLPYIQDFADKHLPTIQEALSGVGDVVGVVLTWISDHWEIITTIGAILLSVAATISTVSTVLGILNAVMALSPITLIVAGIAALVAGFVLLWNKCDAFREFWQDLWEKIKEVFSNLVEQLKPLIDAMVGAFKEAWELIKVVWDIVKPYFEALWNDIKIIFSVVKDVLSTFFKAAWENIKIVWDVVVKYFTTLWNNIKLVFSVVKDVLTGDFKGAWEGIKGIFSNWTGFFSELWDSVVKIFKNIGSAVGDAVSSTVKVAINSVLSTAVGIINGFISAINAAIGVINAIPGVNISKLNKLSVPKMAEGGVVNSATLAMIGEAGTEAVVPLENNLGWLDKLATMLNERMGGNHPIILQVDGKTFAQISVDSINQLTRQTGNLPLVIA